jgi:hypothetical protein
VEDSRYQDLRVYDPSDFSKDPGYLDGMIDVWRAFRVLTPLMTVLLSRKRKGRQKARRISA